MISPRSGITLTMHSFPFAISFEERGLHLTATLTHYLSDILNIFLSNQNCFIFKSNLIFHMNSKSVNLFYHFLKIYVLLNVHIK